MSMNFCRVVIHAAVGVCRDGLLLGRLIGRTPSGRGQQMSCVLNTLEDVKHGHLGSIAQVESVGLVVSGW